MIAEEPVSPQEAPFVAAANQAPTAKPDTFYIGLCMAGAVSAGAYTAGVMDYLIEALDKWEQRRGQPGVPGHRVEIPVIGGASAGGMTGIITAAILNQEMKPVSQSLDDLMKGQPQNPLYHAWVDLTGEEDMFASLLKNEDIRDQGTVFSLLNASFIKQIADERIKTASGTWIDRPYFSKQLKLFATLSNLKGFTRSIAFNDASNAVKNFFITRHCDYACFVVDTSNHPSATGYSKDGWVPVDFRTADEATLEFLRCAAMATGAFPVGLRSREVKRLKNYVKEMDWVQPYMDEDDEMEDPYTMDFVDGGLINNEPFDKVRDVLLGITGQHGHIETADGDKKEERHDPDSFKGTVLMIDPFPSVRDNFKPDGSIFSVINRTLAAMISHLRGKGKDIIDAMQRDTAGQFLIAPRRKVPDGHGGISAIDGSKAIACGSLGGFGGFLNKEFRIHDYLLGRVNCEKFLRDHFTVPADTINPIFLEGYQQITDRTQFTSRTNGGLQIIPLFDEEEKKFPLVGFPGAKDQLLKDWPVRRKKEISRYDNAIRNRIHTITTTLVKGVGWRARTLIWIAARLVLNRSLSGVMLDKIREALISHQLLLDDNGVLIHNHNAKISQDGEG